MTQVYQATGANDTPVLVPGWTVQSSFSGANGGSNQGLTGASAGTGGLNSGVYQNGFAAQTIQTEDLASAGVALTSGTVYASKMILSDPVVSTKGAVYLGGTAVAGPTHAWLYLLDTAGNIKAQTADLTSTSFNSTSATVNSLYSVPWTSPVSLGGGQYYFAVLSIATTGPALVGVLNPNAINNMNLAAVSGSGSYRFAKLGTGVGASGLSGPVTMTSITPDVTNQIFGALL